jgi:hypothetical protein
MLVYEERTQHVISGPCSDCGTLVEQRTECADAITHSMVTLCPTCWTAYQQRQIFAATGCCG